MTEFEFECPHCSECTVVDGGARELLLTEGCIFCGRDVPSEAFQSQPET